MVLIDMYQVGDVVVYGGITSVCRIANIAVLNFSGSDDGSKLYYVLKPLYQDCLIYNPVDNTDVFMRPVITKDEAEKLIDMIPEIKAEAFDGRGLKEINEHYGAIIKTRDCAKLIELTMSVYVKKQVEPGFKRRYGTAENTFMKQAEDMLWGELAVALDIPKKQVPEYIAARISGKTDLNRH
jgi:CarD family transcriptional regulator